MGSRGTARTAAMNVGAPWDEARRQRRLSSADAHLERGLEHLGIGQRQRVGVEAGHRRGVGDELVERSAEPVSISAMRTAA